MLFDLLALCLSLPDADQQLCNVTEALIQVLIQSEFFEALLRPNSEKLLNHLHLFQYLLARRQTPLLLLVLKPSSILTPPFGGVGRRHLTELTICLKSVLAI